MEAKLLEVSGLRISIGATAVVEDVSFSLGPGEVLALLGESGCGKSLTALSLLGLLPRGVRLSGGRILLEGEDLTRLSERRMRTLRGRRMAMIFQEPTAALDPLAPVGSQVAEAMRQRDRHRVERMLGEVGIAEPALRARQYPFELSGGMSQRAMIASALIANPAVLVADEPTTALDVTTQAQILDLLRELVRGRRMGIILITHDLGVVADIADRVLVMYAGRIAETAPVEELFARPRHPYTAMLLKSVPRLADVPKTRLRTIEGSVPPIRLFGPGCRFAARCPLADGECAAAPPMVARSPGHSSACWHADRLS